MVHATFKTTLIAMHYRAHWMYYRHQQWPWILRIPAADLPSLQHRASERDPIPALIEKHNYNK
jgi:hypothetical protein